jgi:phenylacetate-coenzyme A ligase PaaK-like adenylate-forming protein
MLLNLADVDLSNFENKALEVFNHQRENNPIYSEYCRAILKTDVREIKDIPFLPISFFKSHKVTCLEDSNLSYFESSGTSGQVNSKHYYQNLDLYHQSIELGFQYFFGDKKYTIVGLLPHYLERQHSSLVAMVRHWMSMKQQEEYFYLSNLDELNDKLNNLLMKEIDVLLIGISFALLDFSELFKIENSKLKILETGGMKGSRPEIAKEELVKILQNSFPQSKIISEYGMCELFSQAYSDTELWFSTPPWMRVLVGDINDPRLVAEQGRGPAKIIDLANINSCAFIETQDLIDLKPNGQFQILGRINQADVRGCSLMYS